MPAPRRATSARNALLARLHCIKRDQAWSEDEYRDILEARTGQRSASALDDRTLIRLINSLDPSWAQRSAPAGGGVPPRSQPRLAAPQGGGALPWGGPTGGRRAQTPHEWTWVDTAPEAKRPKLRKLIMLAKGAGIAKGGQVAWIEGIARQMGGLADAGPIEKPLAMCDEGELWRLIQAVSVHVRRQGGDPNAV